MNTVVIGLGTNMGDRLKNLNTALHALSLVPQTNVIKASRIYQTKPVGYDELYDADIAALIEQQIHTIAEKWTLDSYKVHCGTGQVPGVSLWLRRGDEKHTVDVECGDGPIDAVFLAIEQATGFTVVCRDFTVHSVTLGKDAQGEAMVQVEHGGRMYRGRAVSTDSVEASAKAFLNAINRIAAISSAAPPA